MDVVIAERKKKARKILVGLRELFPNAVIALHYKTPWELLVAVELSAQCTDKKVNEVTEVLFKKYPTFEHYVRASLTKKGVHAFEQAIKQTGFYHAKTKNILAAARMVKDVYGGVIPRTMEKMLTIPGIGRKSANVILGNLYGVHDGIAVDTHVRRLSRLFGLSTHTDPEKIERDLMAVIPKKEWFIFTYRLINYGRAYCSARSHRHAGCPLAKFSLEPVGAMKKIYR